MGEPVNDGDCTETAQLGRIAGKWKADVYAYGRGPSLEELKNKGRKATWVPKLADKVKKVTDAEKVIEGMYHSFSSLAWTVEFYLTLDYKRCECIERNEGAEFIWKDKSPITSKVMTTSSESNDSRFDFKGTPADALRHDLSTSFETAKSEILDEARNGE